MANTAFEHSPTLQVPGSTTTNGLVTWDANDGGGFLSSSVVLSTGGALSTLTSLVVDTITIDGTSITTTASNNPINLTPHGTGAVVITKTSTPTILLTNSTNAYAITLNTGTTAANYTITMPTAAPGATGKILQTSGSDPWSTLVWADAGAANQNAWTTITRSATGTGTAAGDASVAATTTTDSLDLVAGDNITITGDSSNQKYTIAAAASTFIGVKAVHGSNQPFTSGSEAAVTFTATDEWDTITDGNGMHSTSSNPSRITFRVAGKYFIQGHVQVGNTVNANGNTVGRRHLGIRLNAGNRNVVSQSSPSLSDQWGHQVSVTLDVSVDDYVELVFLQTSGYELAVQYNNGSPWFSAHKID